ncbi:MAG TPA: methyl-accepting chemotaxis protein [Leptolyngbyaceae cyanobacterium]
MMEANKKFWKLRYWIVAGYAIPVVALILSAGVTVVRVKQLRTTAADVKETNEISRLINEVNVESQIMSRATRGYLLGQEDVSVKNYENAKTDYLNHVTELEEKIRSEEQQQNLEELKKRVNDLEAINGTLISMVKSGQVNEAVEAWKADGGRQQAQAVDDMLAVMDDLEQDILKDRDLKQEEALRSLQTTLILATLTSVLFSLVVGAWIILKTASQMNGSANNIASSTAEIAASVEQQERIASQQAASVNETTTTIDELGASSRQSAEQAEAAAAGAKQALDLAEGGAQAVDLSLQGMDLLRQKVGAIADQILRLSEQTSQIGSISGLVSDLANQTNMLALNAAVEAVRAGEHGKGFAVVSGEIRKLADQSKKSAEKINALVSDIQNAINSTVMVTDEGTKTVEESVSIANRTAQAFAGVTDAMNNVVLNSQQISLNVQQQAIAIQQVVGAMNGLNTAARETASGIGQIKVGTQRLNDAANELKVLV